MEDTRQELEKRMDELARAYAAAPDEDLKRNIEKLSRALAKLRELQAE